MFIILVPPIIPTVFVIPMFNGQQVSINLSIDVSTQEIHAHTHTHTHTLTPIMCT